MSDDDDIFDPDEFEIDDAPSGSGPADSGDANEGFFGGVLRRVGEAARGGAKSPTDAGSSDAESADSATGGLFGAGGVFSRAGSSDADATKVGQLVDTLARAGKKVADTVREQIPGGDPEPTKGSVTKTITDVMSLTDPDADADRDGLTNAQEATLGTNPLGRDTDHDGITDADEFKRGTRPDRADTDGDGLQDGTERQLGLDPRRSDSDGDGVGDLGDTIITGARDALGTGSGSTRATKPSSPKEPAAKPKLAETKKTNPDASATPAAPSDPAGTAAKTPTEQGDSDEDGLTDVAEAERGTDPFDPDTDRDGLGDGYESREGTDPTKADTDGDGLADNLEIHGTSATNADTDGDGVDDGDEYVLRLDPTKADTDGDGRTDREELDHPDPDPENSPPATASDAAATTAGSAADPGDSTMSTKIPDGKLLLERAAQLRAEAAEQRNLAVEKNVADNARHERAFNDGEAQTAALKAGIATNTATEDALRNEYVAASNAAKQYETDAAAAEKAGKQSEAEELREHGRYQEVEARSKLQEANELSDRITQQRVDLLEIEQNELRGTTAIRTDNRSYNEAEAELDKMDQLARELETAGRRSLAASSTDNIPERAQAELDAEAAWGRAQQITVDATRIAAHTGNPVETSTDLSSVQAPTSAPADSPFDAATGELSAMNIGQGSTPITPPVAPTPFVDQPHDDVVGEGSVQPPADSVPPVTEPEDGTVTPQPSDIEPDTVDFGDGTVRAPIEDGLTPDLGPAPVEPSAFEFDDGAVRAPTEPVQFPEPELAPTLSDAAGSSDSGFGGTSEDFGSTDDFGSAEDAGFVE